MDVTNKSRQGGAELIVKKKKKKKELFFEIYLPCFLSLQFTFMQSWATNIAGHILPLGDLLDINSAN